VEYQQQVNNLREAKRELSIERIADDFFEQLNACKFLP